jgi:hypothetical protein
VVHPVKGIVQRKLRWVKNGTYRWVCLKGCGAGHYLLILQGGHLGYNKKSFAANKAQFISTVEKNLKSAGNGALTFFFCNSSAN